MEDDEFSYTGYSDSTREQIGENVAVFTDSEDVYCVEADRESAATDARTGSYGDFLVEEFSAESHITKVTSITHLPKNAVTYFIAAVYLIVGVLCVSLPVTIMHFLPYIVGGMMTVIGVVQFIVAMVHREYRDARTNQTATSLMVLALGIMIIIQELDEGNDSAIMLISVAWGILGLFEAAHAFNIAFMRIAKSERCVFVLLKGIVECVVAFYLLYRPDSHEAHMYHIIVFGVNLIFDSVTMLPPVHKFLHNK